jgi:hypothetical protein
MTKNQPREADDLVVRLARIKDLIEELNRLGLKTRDYKTECEAASAHMAFALRAI